MPKSAKLLLRGSFLRIATLTLSIAISFFMMPFLVGALGDRWYGLWVLVGTFMGYYGLLDFGLSSATQRYVAVAISENDNEGVNIAITTSTITFSALSALTLVISSGVILAAPMIFDAAEDIEVFRAVIGVMAIKVAACFPLYAFNGVLTAKLRFDIASNIELGKLILRTALFVYYISTGHSIIALAVITAVVEISAFCLIAVIAYRLHPSLQLRWKYCQIARLREFVTFGKYVFVTSIADKVRFSLDGFVIASNIGLATVTHYLIAGRLIEISGQALRSLFGVVMPVLIDDYSNGQWPALRNKFLVFSKLACASSLYFACLLLAMGDEFIVLWMGEAYLDAYPPLLLLVTVTIFAGSQQPSVSLFYALAKHQYYAYLTVCEAICNLVLSLILVRYLGMVGVALGTVIPLAVSKGYFQPRYACQQLEISLASYYRRLLPELCFGTVAFLFLLIATQQFRLVTFWDFCIVGGVFTIFYAFIYTRLIADSSVTETLRKALPLKISTLAFGHLKQS